MKRRRRSQESISANVTGPVGGQVGVGTNISQTQQVGAQEKEGAPPKPQKWWQTLPAKIAAAIATFATLVTALHQAGLLPVHHEPAKSSLSSPAQDVRDPYDIAREAKLIGHWNGKRPLWNDLIWDCTTKYSRDKKFISSGLVTNPAGQSSSLTITGRWSIKGDELLLTNESAAGDWGKVIIGQPYAFKIVRLTDDEFTFDDGTFTHRQVTVTRSE
jgi:hypothetical protein